MSAVLTMKQPIIRHLGMCDYIDIHTRMREFTDGRIENTQDEIWFVQHWPVFTLGRNGNKTNILTDFDIAVIHSDRGGDITYHGPGQLIVYCLIDLKRLQLGVKTLVYGLEQIVIQYLSTFDVVGERINSAPGVYVGGDKLASLGLRVRHGCSFHGLAINVDMDQTPFSYINPCGLKGMQVTQLSEFAIHQSCDQVALSLSKLIIQQFYK
ncbi:MAG: lipoyl(octanoyl) transferase LipB [Gammaproteobacteria bacterium]|nr:lipoyl(octanoyl) transferase LipB [Gammaproteobacteria bacterium]